MTRRFGTMLRTVAPFVRLAWVLHRLLHWCAGTCAGRVFACSVGCTVQDPAHFEALVNYGVVLLHDGAYHYAEHMFKQAGAVALALAPAAAACAMCSSAVPPVHTLCTQCPTPTPEPPRRAHSAGRPGAHRAQPPCRVCVRLPHHRRAAA
jgi:hypothetical protein